MRMGRRRSLAALAATALIAIGVSLAVSRGVSIRVVATGTGFQVSEDLKVVSPGKAMRASDGEMVTVTGHTSMVALDGGECVEVDLLLSNQSRTEWTLPFSEMSDQTSVPDAYPSSYGFGLCQGQQNIGSIAAGESVSAKIFFDVSGSIQSYNLTWSPTATGEVFDTPLPGFG